MSQRSYDFLALRHYSRSRPVTCTLVSGTLDSFFTVRLNESTDLFSSILKGDPVLFGKSENSNETTIFGGFVLSKTYSGEMTVSPDMTSFDVEKRKNARYPVSIFGYIRHGLNKEDVSSIWVKDISYEGMRISSETSLEVEEKIDVNICISNNVANIEGTVIRKKALYDRYEYGIQITFKYKRLIFTTREFIDNLVNQERKLIESHLSTLMT